MGRRRIFGIVAAGLAGLSGAGPAQAESWRLVPERDLSAMLDCMGAAGQTLVSAHRGGPGPGLPENSVAKMSALLASTPAMMEVDVARSSDGVHYLMHDRTLDRTTTGTGSVSALDWETIRQLYLKDEAGWVTPYRVPSLEQALTWAKGRTVLQIDFKSGADVTEIVTMIRAAGMAGQVILISYTLDQAKALHAAAPEMLISYSTDDASDIAAAVAAGIPADRIVAFTGTRVVRPDLYTALQKQDVEVIFGTLGRSEDAFDVVIDRYGMDARYADLGRLGTDILATDRPREAAAALEEAGRLPQAGQCGVSKGE